MKITHRGSVKKKSSGADIVPWGTPELPVKMSDMVFFSLMYDRMYTKPDTCTDIKLPAEGRVCPIIQ